MGWNTWRERTVRVLMSDRASGRSFDRGGYPGLEGDFEFERRRAALASDETVTPYEHGEGEAVVLPVTEPGLTHP